MRRQPTVLPLGRAGRIAALLLTVSGTLLLGMAGLLWLETVRFATPEGELYRRLALFWLVPGGLGGVLLGALLAVYGGKGRHRGLAVLVMLATVAAAVGATILLRREPLGGDELILFGLPWWALALLGGALGHALWRARPPIPPAPRRVRG